MSQRVLSGYVDVFSEGVGRRHLVRVLPGQLVGDGPWLSVPGPDSATEPAEPDLSLLEGWLAALVAGIVLDPPPPGAVPYTAPTGRSVINDQGVVWVRGTELSLQGGLKLGVYPLAPGLVLERGEGVVLERVDVSLEEARQALEILIPWLAEREKANLETLAFRRTERAALERKVDLEQMTAAMGAFAEVLSPRPRVRELPSHETRAVRLRGKWWKTDSGPLEVRRKGTGETMVLHSPYQLDARQAAEFESDALALYPAWEPSVPLWRFGLRGTHKDLRRLLVLGLLGGLLSLLLPMLTGLVVGRILPGGVAAPLVAIGLALLAATLTTSVLDFVSGVALLRATGRMEARMQAALFMRLLSLPPDFFRQRSAGDLSNRVTDLGQVRQILGGPAMVALLSALFSSWVFPLLFFYSVPLALWAVGLSLLWLGLSASLAWRQMALQRTTLAQQGALSSLVLQLLTGIAKLRAAGAVRRAYALWARNFAGLRRTVFASNTVNARLAVLSGFAVAGLPAAIVMADTVWSTDPERFIPFFAAFGQFVAAVFALNSSLTQLLLVPPLFERADTILKATPEDRAARPDPGPLSGRVELSRIAFRYRPDGPLTLEDLSLKAEPGEFIAIVGPSGAGKSTLVRLLLGFEQPESGSVLFDGKDLQRIDVRAVRRQCGVVLQDGRLLLGDIFRNIVGSSPHTLDEAWEAARVAGIEDEIKSLPMGMRTWLMEGGGTFSGGERQRLMIARAVVSKPRILILDEATSALDSRTQEAVTRALEQMQATRIVIAHRLSTIRKAHRVYVLQAGQRVQEGTYEELMEDREGLFYALASRQTA